MKRRNLTPNPQPVATGVGPWQIAPNSQLVDEGRTGAGPLAGITRYLHREGRGGSVAALSFPTVIGTTYTISLYIRAAGLQNYDFRIVSTAPLSVPAWQTLIADQWGRISLTLTATRTTTSVSAEKRYNSYADVPILDITGIHVEETDTLDSYFDGNTPDTSTSFHGWDGDPLASPSYQTDESLIVTPITTEGRVRIQWSGTPTPVTQITATDINGTRTVRTIENTLPAPAGVVDDWEVALHGQAAYTLHLTDGTTITTPSVTMDGYPAAGLITIPQDPALESRPALLLDWRITRTAATAPDTIIGRADKLGTDWEHTAGDVSFTALFTSPGAAYALQELLARPRTILLRQPDHERLDLYFRTSSTTVLSTPGGRVWLVQVLGYEQSAPAGPVLGSPGWDYATLSASLTSYAALEQAYPDYVAVEAG